MNSLPLFLDGATGTNLMKAGLPVGVCPEAWILEHPDALLSLQSAFVKAGAQVIYAPTFSANRVKLSRFGLEGQLASLNAKLVALSKQAADGKALVAGNLSPTGLFCKPFGEIEFVQLVEIYKEQASALHDAGVDLFVCETMMSLSEMRAAALAARDFEKPVFVTMTVDEKGRSLSGGQPLACLYSLAGLSVAAFGLNCSCGPDKMLPIITELARYSPLPVIAKPNAGNPTADSPSEYDLSPSEMGKQIAVLYQAGAKIVGGCCGTTPEHLKEIVQNVKEIAIPETAIQKESASLPLCNETTIFTLPENPTVSCPIPCSEDMTDDIMDALEEEPDLALITLNTPEDARNFALFSYLIKLPVLFRSDSAEALAGALLHYNGIAAVSKDCSLSEKELLKLSSNFGAKII